MGERVEVEIDRDRCMGSGNCVFLAPETFDLSEDGHAVVLDPGATDEARLRAAAEGCPVGAISLHKGGVVLVPGQTDLVPHETEG